MKHNPRLTRNILFTKANDTRKSLDFHLECLAELRRMYHYPTGENLPSLYWRAYFMDNNLELSATVGEVFEEHMNRMEAEIGMLEDLSRRPTTSSIERFHIIPSFLSIITWNLSRTASKNLFRSKLLNQLIPVLLSVFVTSVTMSWLGKLSKSFMLRSILYRTSPSFQFLDKHLETLTKAHNKLSGRDFCITDTGHVGWVSRFANEGDQICIFRGSRFPFVIRRVGPCHSRRYRLRGDCYIHGLMEENLFKIAKADVETIKLV